MTTKLEFIIMKTWKAPKKTGWRGFKKEKNGDVSFFRLISKGWKIVWQKNDTSCYSFV